MFQGEAGAGLRRLARLVATRQHAAGERVVGDDADAVRAAERQHLVLDHPKQQVVARLDAVEAGEAVRVAGPEGVTQLPGREVGAADVAHLARLDQCVQGAQRLLNGRVRVGRVDLVQVNVVGLQAAQAVLAGAQDVLAREALLVRRLAHGAPALGRQHDPFARPALGQPAAHDLLRPPDLLRAAAKGLTTAVSKNVTPASSAASMMAKEASCPAWLPKAIVPRHTSLTWRPVRPIFLVFMIPSHRPPAYVPPGKATHNCRKLVTDSKEPAVAFAAR